MIAMYEEFYICEMRRSMGTAIANARYTANAQSYRGPKEYNIGATGLSLSARRSKLLQKLRGQGVASDVAQQQAMALK